MKKPIAFSTIGAFVVTGLVILVSGILFFGSGRVFTTSQDYVMFFNQSVNGLRMGAPVKFRGVEVGVVDRIALGGGSQDVPQVAVFVQLFQSSALKEFGFNSDFSHPEAVSRLIKGGLKAQLRSQSILSGELYINLDMTPEKAPDFVLPSDSAYLEIPTIRSGLLEDFTAQSADMSHSVTATLDKLQKVLTSVDTKLDPLANESILTMQEIRSMMRTVTEFLDPDSPFGHQAPRTLGEIEKAAKAIRLLAEYLERNPSSMIFGKSRVEVVDIQ